MNCTLFIYTALAFVGIFPTGDVRADVPFQKTSIPQLEHRRDAIDTELAQLANFSLRSGVGSIGFRSKNYTDPSHREWRKIDF
jgi:hypothetical protein